MAAGRETLHLLALCDNAVTLVIRCRTRHEGR
jgi:hypothetical protein